MTYKVALCGLTARDERLIEIVISRAPNPKHHYTVGEATALGKAHIAVVDAASLHVESQLVNLRTLNPSLIVIYVSDLGLSGESRYRIERRSLLLHIGRVLDSVVVNELLTASSTGASTPPKANAANALQPKSAISPNALGGRLERPHLQPLRALIVDDSLAVREQLRSALDRSGILSDSAQDAVSAIAQLAANRYDLVFLDVVMPGSDGYEVCRSIKKDIYTRGIPVLMLTSRSSPFDRARGALAGCDSYLVKPITWETFFTAVDKVLSKHFRNDRALLGARGYRSALMS